jgi:membrane protein YdbS with pleckstrin-like domain
MNLALLVTSAILAVAWIPVLVRFFRNWRTRANPISLAICFLVAFSIYLCFVPFLGPSNNDPLLTALVIEGVNAVTCLFFYVSFGWARRKWNPKNEKLRRENGDFPTEETPP